MLRQSISIQRLYEKDARGGTRYKEILLSHFGVAPKDSRLQRPEYLGGGTVKVGVNQIAQTAPAASTGTNATELGDLGAWATAVGSPNGFTKTFEEHCVILGILSGRADLNYQQGVSKMHARRTRWDYYWPELSGLGEQAVLDQEIFASGDETDGNVFGYQERFAEYRYKPSEICGKFRSDGAGSLDVWHLAQDFGDNRPVLGNDFIIENPPVKRIIIVQNEPELLIDSHFDYRTIRPMPVYGVPGLTRL
jgi:hypothetical protein